MESNGTIQEIDFLPDDFKRRRKSRHGRSWQLAITAAAIGLVVIVAVEQSRAKRRIEVRLAEIEPERRLLATQLAELGEMRTELVKKDAQAELVAYMGHPWPKTQLLAAALRSLPDAIVVRRIRISHEAPPGQRAPRRGGDSAEQDLAAQPPAARDLRLLAEECDSATVVISLDGLTTDGIELYRYLDRLNDEPLLAKAELHSLESTEDESDVKFRFEVRLTVRPGFGQPRGPDGQSRLLAQTTNQIEHREGELRQP